MLASEVTALAPAMRTVRGDQFRRLNWLSHRFYCCSLVELVQSFGPPELASADGDAAHQPLRLEVCDAYDREQIARGSSLRAIR